MTGNNKTIQPGVDGLIRGFWTTIALLSLLTGCGGGGGDFADCQVSPSPSINSTPPTTATVGERYYYYADANLVCGNALLIWSCGGIEPVQLPPGATAGTSAITWTPSSDWKNRTASFAINTREDACGNRASQSWTVKVLPDQTPPAVMSTDPLNGGAVVPVNTSIDVFFSEAVDTGTVTLSSFTVTGPTGNVGGSISVSGNKASFIPTETLQFLTTYSATLDRTIKDTDGNALASTVMWSFTTEETVDTAPPSVPMNLVANQIGLSFVDISWGASSDDRGVIGYKIYQDGKLFASLTSGTRISIDDLQQGTEYCFAVSAYDRAGNESSISSSLCDSTQIFLTGQVAVWGKETKAYPAIVTGMDSVVSITAEARHLGGFGEPLHGDGNLFLRNDGTVWYEKSLSQVPVLTDIVSVTSGAFHYLAVDSDGKVWGWGDNNSYQLGQGTLATREVPAQISGLSDVIAVAAGDSFSLALRSDGTVWGWGRNTYYVSGYLTGFTSPNPVPLAGLSGIVAIAAGNDHSLALKSDGTVWAWGANTLFGELGDGTTISREEPKTVRGLSDVVAISTFRDHSLALKSDGTVWAWGANSYGQLGDGSNENRYAPVKVTGLTGVTAISAGLYHSLAASADGTVWAWGQNNYGQLGDGTTISKQIPVPVGGLQSASFVFAGIYVSGVVK